MRAALRISARSIRRHPWRSSIVVAMVLLPVAVLTGILAAMAGADAHQEQISRAQLRGANVLYGGSEQVGPNETEAQIRGRLHLPGGAVVTGLRDGGLAQNRRDGTADTLRWMEADWSTADAHRIVDLTDGAWPARPGEIATSDHDHPIGSTYAVSLPETTVTVVGWIRRSEADVQATELIAARSTFPASDDHVWTSSALGPPQNYWRLSNIDDTTAQRLRPYDWFNYSTGKAQLASVGLSTFGFVWCGLVAASALAIGARRRRRELGLLATNGATPRQLRSAILADGLVLGGLGALLGVGVGIAGVAWWNDVGIEWFINRTGDGWSLTPLVAAAPIMGWLSAIVAGALAGRGVSRQPVIDLLAGRGPRPGSAPRWIGVGLAAGAACFAFGIAAAGMDTSGNGRARPILQIACGATGVVALIAISVGLIRTLPGLTARGGLPMRTAARDLARFGARTTAATAAIAITLSGATFASLGEREAARQHGFQLNDTRSAHATPASTATVGAPRQAIVAGRLVDAGLTPEAVGRLRDQGRRDGFRVTTIRQTSGAKVCVANASAVATSSGVPTDVFDSDGCIGATAIRVPATEVARLDAPMRDALQAGRAVGYSNYGGPTPADATFRIGSDTLPVASVNPPLYGQVDQSPFTDALTNGSSNFVTVLLPESAWTPSIDGLATDLATITDQRGRDGERWSTFTDSLGVGVRDINTGYVSEWNPWIAWELGGGIALVCLLVMTLALVLVRIESRDEENVLTTQGASRAVIARICGWRAALVTWTAALPAVALSLLFAWVVGSRFMLPHPISLAMLLVGLPAIAGLIFGAAGLRRAKPPVTVT